MRYCANLSCLKTFYKAKLRTKAVQDSRVSLESAPESDTEGSLSKPTTGQILVLTVNPSTFNQLITSELKDIMHETSIQGSRRIFAGQAS